MKVEALRGQIRHARGKLCSRRKDKSSLSQIAAVRGASGPAECAGGGAGRGAGERYAWFLSQEVRHYGSISASPGHSVCCGCTLSSILKAWVTQEMLPSHPEGRHTQGQVLGSKIHSQFPGDLAKTCCHGAESLVCLRWSPELACRWWPSHMASVS